MKNCYTCRHCTGFKYYETIKCGNPMLRWTNKQREKGFFRRLFTRTEWEPFIDFRDGSNFYYVCKVGCAAYQSRHVFEFIDTKDDTREILLSCRSIEMGHDPFCGGHMRSINITRYVSCNEYQELLPDMEQCKICNAWHHKEYMKHDNGYMYCRNCWM